MMLLLLMLMFPQESIVKVKFVLGKPVKVYLNRPLEDTDEFKICGYKIQNIIKKTKRSFTCEIPGLLITDTPNGLGIWVTENGNLYSLKAKFRETKWGIFRVKCVKWG